MRDVSSSAAWRSATPAQRAVLHAVVPAHSRFPTPPDAASWRATMGLAEAQGESAALWRAVRAAGMADQAPPDDLARLQRLAMRSDFARAYLRQRLASTLELLTQAGIAVLPLKGAAMLLGEHPGGADRPMADLDLLVRPADATRARTLCIDAGGWEWREDGALAAFYAGSQHLPPLDDRQPSGLYVELHTDLFPVAHPFAWGAADLWARAHPHAPLQGVWLPAADDFLLHVAQHFAWSHMFAHGLWRMLRDVAALLAGGTVAWPALVERAHATRAGTACYWSFRLARDLAAVPVPADVLRALAPAGPARQRDLLMRHVTSSALSAGAACPSRALARAIWAAAVQPGPSGHGSARPWARDRLFRPSLPGTPGSMARVPTERVLPRAARAAGRWQAYLRSLRAAPTT